MLTAEKLINLLIMLTKSFTNVDFTAKPVQFLCQVRDRAIERRTSGVSILCNVVQLLYQMRGLNVDKFPNIEIVASYRGFRVKKVRALTENSMRSAFDRDTKRLQQFECGLVCR